MVPFVLEMSYDRFKYGVSLYSKFVVNLRSLASQFANVKFFQGVHQSPFVSILDYIHYVFHGAWNHGHDFGPMENIMDVVQYTNKGRLMDTLEKFYIYELTCKGSQINDKLTIQRNPIFETVVRHFQHKGNH